MSDNIFTLIADSVKDKVTKIGDYVVPPKRSSEQARIIALARDAQALISDPRYESLNLFIKESVAGLQKNLVGVLTNDFGDNYTREKRSDKAAIIAAQIALLEVIQSRPYDIIKQMEEYAKE